MYISILAMQDPSRIIGSARVGAALSAQNVRLLKSKVRPVKGLTKKAKSQVQRLIRTSEELKYFDSNSTAGQQYGSAGTQTDTTAIAQGVGGTNRAGDQIRLERMEFSGSFFQQTTNPYSVARIIVYQWRLNTSAGAPTLGNILDVGPSGSSDVYSRYNFDIRKEFNILYDKKWCMVGGTSASNNMVNFAGRIDLRKVRPVMYNLAATTGDNHVYMLILGSNAAGATGQLVSIAVRVFFRDA